MKIAFSHCPNDTFIFHAWVHGLLPHAPTLDVTYADIDTTNQWAINGSGLDIMKISYATLPLVLTNYTLLPCGGALGKGYGPLILFKQSITDPVHLTEKRIAIPSKHSTAYLLFQLWIKEHVPAGVGEIVVMPFDHIMPAICNGSVDAGLVIHEARFIYPSFGLTMFVDLGHWWTKTTAGLPLPLGAIVARKTLHTAAISHWIRTSLTYAWTYPQTSRSYVLQHAQAMSPEVTDAHIHLYVNEFTADLGNIGYTAVETLLKKAAANGIVPPIEPPLFRC